MEKMKKMEKMIKILKNFKYLISFILIVIFISYSSIKNKGSEMLPLVYLIPEDYFGPVFVLFGQKDGVEMMPDPLGQAVLVPENGIIKIKKHVDSILEEKKPKYQNMYWISVSKDGIRKNMIINENTMKDADWKSYEVYYDENGIAHKNFTGNKKFHYFSEKQKTQNMIFGHGGCGQNNFMSENDSTGEPPACGMFLVISPNAYMNLPKWMWGGAHHHYPSVQKLVEESDERLKKKKLFYNLP